MTVSIGLGRVTQNGPMDNSAGSSSTTSPAAYVTLGHYVRANEAAKCDCPRQCRRLAYNYRVSQARLSNFIAIFAKHAFRLDDSVDKILNDHCSLEVRADQTAVANYARAAATKLLA